MTYTIITDTLIHSYYWIQVNSQLAFSSKSKIESGMRVKWVRQKELINKHLKNFLFLRSYFERLSVTGTNESNKRTFSWMFSFINIVNIVLCFILYTFSFFSRTYFMLIVYFTPSVISSNGFVKIMVVVCNPQNYLKFKFVFYIPLRLNLIVLNK